MKSLIFIISIISSTRAITFNCTFDMASAIYAPTAYTCLQPILSNLNEGENLTAVYGQHMSGKSNVDVKYLAIEDDILLTFFPRAMENFFPNLQAISIIYTSISSLSGDELNPFESLFFFASEENFNLERVPANLFNFQPLMRHIDFSDNNIKYVGEDMFSSMANLFYLDFEFNYCVDLVASNNTEEMQFLIEHLNNNCTEFVDTTTTLSTTPSPPSTSTEEPSCGDTNEIVCILQEQNKILMEMNAEMSEEIKNLNTKIDDISLDMETKFTVLSQDNSIMKQKLDEVIEGILELSTRPCGI